MWRRRTLSENMLNTSSNVSLFRIAAVSQKNRGNSDDTYQWRCWKKLMHRRNGIAEKQTTMIFTNINTNANTITNTNTNTNTNTKYLQKWKKLQKGSVFAHRSNVESVQH